MFVWWAGVECGARMLTRLPCLMSCTSNLKKNSWQYANTVACLASKPSRALPQTFFYFIAECWELYFGWPVFFFLNLFWLTLVSPVLLDYQNTSPLLILSIWTAINANQSQDPLVPRPMSQFSRLSLKQHWSRSLPSRSPAVMHSPGVCSGGTLVY